MLSTMGNTIQVKHTEWIDLRSEAKRRRTLHKRSMQREAELKQQLREKKRQVADLSARLEQKEKTIQQLTAQNEWLRKQLFGRSTEKGKGATAQKSEDTEKTSPETKEPRTESKKKRNRGQQPGTEGHGRRRRLDLPAKETIHELPPDQRCCPVCGLPYRDSGLTRDSEQIEYEVKIYRHLHRRKCYFPSCDCEHRPASLAAPVPPKLIPKGLIHRSLWSELLQEKWLHHRPLGRALEVLRHKGLDISQGTVTGGLRRITEMMRPVYGRLLGRSASAGRWQMDETGWMVFAPVEEEKTGSRWWLWVVVTDDTVVYLLEPSRSGQVPKNHLSTNAEGILLVDRYGGYKVLPESIILAYCWAHVRRDFVRVAESDTYQSLHRWAERWIDRIGRLYELNEERLEVLGDKKAFAQKDHLLREHVEQMKRIREKELARPNLSLKARAILESLAAHWEGCTVFVEHPMIPMDNNECERRLRGPVCGRKNYYGSGSQWSAELTAMLYSIFDTMKKNDINPGMWLGHYLESCAEAGGEAPAEKMLESFLPWNLTEERKNKWQLSDKPP